MEPLIKLRLPLFILLLILIGGTAGYYSLYPIPLIDAFYMTIISIFTVGYREIYPMDTTGKIFTIVLILSGVSGITFTASSLFQFMIEGHLMGLVKRRKMEKELESLKNHIIICGFGRMGEQIARDCMNAGRAFVVIDSNPEAIERVVRRNYLYIPGSATDDEILKVAGIPRAKGLVVASDSDPDNVLITLSARMLNPSLFIVCRASCEDVFGKMYKAGADRVLSPYLSTGQKMAAMLLKPLVHEYLDTLAYDSDLGIRLEEVEIPEQAKIVGKSIYASAIRERTGTSILAVKKVTGQILTNPGVTTILEKGDRLILVGTTEQLEEAEEKIFQ